MKKLLIVLGTLFGIFIVVAGALPFMVDVDQYRPMLVKAASERLNGKIEIGKLSLSLWGKVHVQVDGIKISDAQGHNILSVSDAYFHLPFFSILDGSPSLILHLEQPTIRVTQDNSGKLNLMGLSKTEAKTEAKTEVAAPQSPAPISASHTATTTSTAPAQKSAPQVVAQTTQPAATGSTELKLPGIVTRARIGLEIKNAQLAYQDEKTGMNSEMKNLNLIAHDISLSHKMSLDLFADVDTQDNHGGMLIQGPLKLTATADPKVMDGKFSSIAVNSTISLDDLRIELPGVFQKDKGIEAHANLSIQASPESIQIEKLLIRFYNAQIEGKGVIANFSGTQPHVNLSLKSNSIELSAWNKLIPMLKQYDLGGSAELSADADGPADKLGYKALFKINGLTAKAPNLKAQPHVDLTLSVITDQIDNLSFSMKAPGNDLSVHGKIVGFNAPHIDFQVASSGLDLDQLINFEAATGSAATSAKPKEVAKEAPPQEVAKPAAPSKTSDTSHVVANSTPANSTKDLDASLDGLRTNKLIQNTVANIGVNLKSIKAKGTTISNFTAKMSMHDLIVALDSFSMGVFGGSIKASVNTNLKPKTPTYKFSMTIADLDMKQAVESQMAAFKNTLMGQLNFDMSGEGASFNTKPATQHLVSKGKLRVVHATFATVDVGKMVADGLSGTMGKLAGKIPGLNGKPAPGAAGASKYDLISSSFSISGGQFSAPDFLGKATPDQGIDLKGSVALGLEDYSLKADWTIIDTYNLTHAKDIGVSAGGISAPHILASGNGPVQFPVSIGCTLMAPCYSYTQASEYLLKVAMGNVSGGAKSAAVGKAKDLLKGLIPGASGSSGSANNNALSGLKKLFGN